jgi:probable HAF family extracellular repeat protein
MTNIEFHRSSLGKMLFLPQVPFKRFFGKRSAVFLSCLVFGVITHAFLQSAEAQIKYTVTRLVPISGVYSSPGGLNAQGDVVGNYIWRDGTAHVFLNHAGIMHDIAALAGSLPTGINIYGRIVGYQLPKVGPYTYFENKAWSLSQIRNFLPLAVNTASHIACQSQLGAFIWEKSGLISLPTPGYFNALAINNADQVVGTAGPNHAFLFSGGQAIDLGTLQNLPGSSSSAIAVNDQGQIVGRSDFVVNGIGTTIHAFIYSGVNSGGRMQDIQTIDPNDVNASSYAFGINNSGQVVGVFLTPANLLLAFVYGESQMIDLDTLIDPAAGWVLDYAGAINDAGQIMARGFFQNETYEEACLLTPVR